MAENVSEYIKKKYGVNLTDEDIKKIMSSIEPSVVTDEGKEPATIESKAETEDKGDLASVNTGQEEKKQDALTAAAEEIRQKGLDKKTADQGKYFEKEFQADKRAEQEDTNNLVSDLDDYLTKEVDKTAANIDPTVSAPGASAASLPSSKAETEDKRKIAPVETVDERDSSKLNDYDVVDNNDLANDLSEMAEKALVQGDIAAVDTGQEAKKQAAMAEAIHKAALDMPVTDWSKRDQLGYDDAVEPADELSEKLPNRAETKDKGSIAPVDTGKPENVVTESEPASSIAPQKAVTGDNGSIAPVNTGASSVREGSNAGTASGGDTTTPVGQGESKFTPTGNYKEDMTALAKQQADAVRKQGADEAQSIRDAAEQSADDVISATDDYIKETTEGYTPLQQAIADKNKSAAQAILDYNNEIKATEQEMKASEQGARRAATAAGYAELAAALFNAIGVSQGANNMVVNTRVSSDWMQQAHSRMRERRARVGSMRDRLRVLQDNMSTLKTKGAEAAFSKLREDAAARRKAREESARIKAEAGRKADAIQNAAAAKAEAIELGTQESLLRQEHKEKIKYSDGYVVEPTTGRKVKIEESGKRGGGSQVTIALAPAKEGGNGYKITINSSSLLATIQANIDLFDGQDKQAIERIIREDGSMDDKAKKMQRFIKTSPEIIKLLNIAGKVEEVEWDKPADAQAKQAKQSGSVGNAADFAAWAANH